MVGERREEKVNGEEVYQIWCNEENWREPGEAD
jgi:hypothetical protein